MGHKLTLFFFKLFFGDTSRSSTEKSLPKFAGATVFLFFSGGGCTYTTMDMFLAFFLFQVQASPVAWKVVRVPIKINFVGSSRTECMLVRAFSCMEEID